MDNFDFHGMTREQVIGKDGLTRQLTSRILQRVLKAEMDEHLGYEKNDNAGDNSGNSRNGYTQKTVIVDDNTESVIQVPCDRNSTFEPQIISMYSFGT